MDLLNAFIALSNYVLIPGIAYGSQLALGALGVTLTCGNVTFETADRSLAIAGTTCAFSRRELALLELFLRRSEVK